MPQWIHSFVVGIDGSPEDSSSDDGRDGLQCYIILRSENLIRRKPFPAWQALLSEGVGLPLVLFIACCHHLLTFGILSTLSALLCVSFPLLGTVVSGLSLSLISFCSYHHRLLLRLYVLFLSASVYINWICLETTIFSEYCGLYEQTYIDINFAIVTLCRFPIYFSFFTTHK